MSGRVSSILSPAPVSSAGRPILLDEESELRTFEDVAVHRKSDQNQDEILLKGILVLTNFRLIKLVETRPNSIVGWEVQLRHVSSFSNVDAIFVASKRTNLHIKRSDGDAHIQLKFNKGGREEFVTLLDRAIARKSWEAVQKKPATPLPPSPAETTSLSNIGIGGILARQTASMQNADSLTRSALTDLDALAQKAREVVNVVQRYAAYMQEAKQAAEEDGLSETSTQVGEMTEMESIMQSIGVISPVTRLSAGRLYHQQVARQLAEVLMHQNRLHRLGGMITLTDLYFLYNRARGTELLSPDDLLSAVQMMETLRLGMHLRTFPSQVKVVQLDSFNDKEWDDRLIQVLNSSEEFRQVGCTASSLSRTFNISIAVCKERLVEAENKGYICRDESVEGIAYFPNRF